MDWITSTPNKAKRILSIRPITRDGGAHLASARSLNRLIERSQYAAFEGNTVEYGNEGFLLTFALIVILGSCSSKPENGRQKLNLLKCLLKY